MSRSREMISIVNQVRETIKCGKNEASSKVGPVNLYETYFQENPW